MALVVGAVLLEALFRKHAATFTAAPSAVFHGWLRAVADLVVRSVQPARQTLLVVGHELPTSRLLKDIPLQPLLLQLLLQYLLPEFLLLKLLLFQLLLNLQLSLFLPLLRGLPFSSFSLLIQFHQFLFHGSSFVNLKLPHPSLLLLLHLSPVDGLLTGLTLSLQLPL